MLAKALGDDSGWEWPLLVVVAKVPAISGPKSVGWGSMPRVREVAAGRLSSAKVVSGCPQKVVCGSAVMAAGIPYWR